MKKSLSTKELLRFIRFGIVGVCNTGVDFLVFYCTTTFLGMGVYGGQIASYSIATLNSYVLNRTWTFASKNRALKKEFLKFLMVNLTSLGLSLILMYGFHDMLKLDKMLCKVLIAFFTIFINYFGNRIWVFNKK